LLAVFGLGNPGKRYAGTRHNVGFQVIDRLAAELGIRVTRRRFRGRVGEGRTDRGRVLLVKPQTYMNESGRTVGTAAGWYRLEPDRLLVVCDDLDLPPGKLRLRRGGSSGGHKGLASVAQVLGTDGFPRLRIGIGRPEFQDPVDYVLAPVPADQQSVLDDAVRLAAEAAMCWAKEGIDICMNRYN
jgi:PTH1 family peptidyl-tRNA hydrolase